MATRKMSDSAPASSTRCTLSSSTGEPATLRRRSTSRLLSASTTSRTLRSASSAACSLRSSPSASWRAMRVAPADALGVSPTASRSAIARFAAAAVAVAAGSSRDMHRRASRTPSPSVPAVAMLAACARRTASERGGAAVPLRERSGEGGTCHARISARGCGARAYASLDLAYLRARRIRARLQVFHYPRRRRRMAAYSRHLWRAASRGAIAPARVSADAGAAAVAAHCELNAAAAPRRAVGATSCGLGRARRSLLAFRRARPLDKREHVRHARDATRRRRRQPCPSAPNPP